MLSADAEHLKVTNSTTLEAEERHTAVIIHTDSAKHEFEYIDRSRGEKDERLGQEFFRGQVCRAREKGKCNGL